MNSLSFDLPGLGFSSLVAPTSAPSPASSKARVVTEPQAEEKEDGEISDVSMRDVSATPQLVVQKKRKRDSNNALPQQSRKMRQLQHQQPRFLAVTRPSQIPEGVYRDAIKQFVQAWLKAGLSYTQLKSEVQQASLLDAIVIEMHSATPLAPTNGTKPHEVSKTQQPKPAVANNDSRPRSSAPSLKATIPSVQSHASRVASPSSALSSKTPVAPNRSEYLARLQAARARPLSASAHSSAVQSPRAQSPSTQASKQLATSFTEPPASIAVTKDSFDNSLQTMNGKPEITPNKQSDKTELIRKKMEALQALAAKRAKAPASPQPQGTVSSPAPPPPSTAALDVETPSLTIPVAVTARSLASASAIPPSKVLQLRTSSIASAGSNSPFSGFREPFGFASTSVSDDTVVMDISDDDDDDSESDAEAPARGRPMAITIPSQPSILGQPQSAARSRSANNLQSVELQRKQLEIAALNQRIAQYEQRKKAQATPIADADSNHKFATGHDFDSNHTNPSDRAINGTVDTFDTTAARPTSAPAQQSPSIASNIASEAIHSDTVKGKRQQLRVLQEQAEHIQAESDANKSSTSTANLDGTALPGKRDAPLHTIDTKEQTNEQTNDLFSSTFTDHGALDQDEIPESLASHVPSNASPASTESGPIQQTAHDHTPPSSADTADAPMDISSAESEVDAVSDAGNTDADMDMDISSSDESQSAEDSRIKQIELGSGSATRQPSPSDVGSSDTSSTYSPMGLEVVKETEQNPPRTLTPTPVPLLTANATAEAVIGPEERADGSQNLDSSIGHFIQATRSREYFQPYKSPLQNFRQYRFHPEYNKTVTGGFRSQTFSHQIDSDNELCRFELDGGICNDPKCSYQHFRDMELSDNAIVVQLGSQSANPGQTEDERKRYNNGLMVLVRQLKTDNISDIEEIARRIAQYRRDFVGDASKILNT